MLVLNEKRLRRSRLKTEIEIIKQQDFHFCNLPGFIKVFQFTLTSARIQKKWIRLLRLVYNTTIWETVRGRAATTQQGPRDQTFAENRLSFPNQSRWSRRLLTRRLTLIAHEEQLQV